MTVGQRLNRAAGQPAAGAVVLLMIVVWFSVLHSCSAPSSEASQPVETSADTSTFDVCARIESDRALSKAAQDISTIIGDNASWFAELDKQRELDDEARESDC